MLQTIKLLKKRRNDDYFGCSFSGEGNNDVNIKLRQILTATWNYKTHTTNKMPKIYTTRCEW